MAKCRRRTDILFANIHAACNEIIAILEKVVSYARQRKAKEDRDAEAMRPRRRRRRFDTDETQSSAMSSRVSQTRRKR